MPHPPCVFFFNDTATTEIYTLSLHDALPISAAAVSDRGVARGRGVNEVCDAAAASDRGVARGRGVREDRDRQSTRLNSSHGYISYAAFSLQHRPRESRRSPRVPARIVTTALR